jgi:uncharacterized protein (DUF1697 family)
MRGEKLKLALESAGLANVRPVITSGNVVFESTAADTAELERMTEAALPRMLGFSREVFVRSQADLQAIVDAGPFAGLVHENAGKTYLTVTFFKTPPNGLPPLPYQPAGKAFKLVAMVDGALCCVVDLTTGKTPDLMAWLEREFGKSLTTRTYATIGRLLEKMSL